MSSEKGISHVTAHYIDRPVISCEINFNAGHKQDGQAYRAANHIAMCETRAGCQQDHSISPLVGPKPFSEQPHPFEQAQMKELEN